MSRTFICLGACRCLDRCPLIITLLLASLCWGSSRTAGAAELQTTPANVVTELAFTARSEHKDPFNDITLDALFTQPGGAVLRVPAFWAGGDVWKVRYASPVLGVHHFKTDCSDKTDAGLNGVEGAVDITPYHGDNPLYIHGPVRVGKGSRYLEYADGTPFFWLGDTWWMGLCKRLAWPDEFQTLAADRKTKGFTVVQIVAGLYPDMPAFDERGANEAGFPWEKDYARIRPEYFDAADKKIHYLVDQGIVPCIVGAWGYHLPWLGSEKMKRHQRYLYARWGALPMAWCVAGELNLPFYLSPKFPNHGEKQTQDWEEVIAYARSINAFGRPISSHPTGIGRLSMRDLMEDPTLLDFDMLQTPHGQMDVIGRSVEAVRFSYTQTPIMPTVNAEPSYEMLWDRTPPEVVRRVFWVCWASGVKGYTYGANGIWQLNRRDQPYGNSPWGGGYGKISWDQAMNLPGSSQVGYGKKLLSGYAWQKFEPHPAWATWADAPAANDVALGDWIWFREGNPAIDAPVAARYFRKSFDLPADARVKQATLAVTADDRCTVWLNGHGIGSHDSWRDLLRVGDLAAKLKPGKNTLAIRAENVKSDVAQNPAGLIAGLRIELEDGHTLEILSDANWTSSTAEAANWPSPDFDDAPWPKAKVIAPRGGGPWGAAVGASASSPDKYTAPYAFGISDEVRFIYVPAPRAIELHDLDSSRHYAAFYFDPATGKREARFELSGVTQGHCRIESPANATDWILSVEVNR